jgi:uncharacterized membrane protein YgdD (TMEM256/DUF423 family)
MARDPKSFCFPLFAAGLLGLTGVALGAMGAHALKAILLERGTLAAWDTAARYHLLHAAALLGLAAWLRTAAGGGARRLVWAARCWCVGVGLFSGSLYWLALGGPRWLGPVTPLGGVALMAGWLLVTMAAFTRKPAG